MLESMVRKTEIALLETELMGPMRMYLEMAQKVSEIESKLLADPKLREIFDQLTLTTEPDSPRPRYEAIDLGNVEALFHRDHEFAALVAKARQKYSNELSALRSKLNADRLVRETFINTVRAPNQTAVFQDVLAALRRLSALSRPDVPASPALMKEAEEFASLLQ